MKIGGFLPNTSSNGIGTRFAIFLTGCPHKCDGCYNEHLWDIDSGVTFTLFEIFEKIKKNIDIINGITLTGGEPFEQAEDASIIAQMAKEEGLDVWTYTGYTLNQLEFSEDHYVKRLLKYTDILVDGKFEKDKVIEGEYKGSSNQRIINMKEEVKYV